MPENIFADAQQEGNAIDNALDNIDEKGKGETTPSESQPDNKQVVKEPSQGGEPAKDNTPEEKIPFHRHPRWIAQNKKYKELEERYTSLEKKLTDVEPLLKQPERLPDWWARRYGETEESTKAYREYQENTQQERERIKEEVLTAIKAEQQNEKVEEKTAKEVIDTQIEEMQDEGLEFETPELMKFILDFKSQYGVGSLLDEDGNYDLRKSLKLMQSLQPKEEDKSIDLKKKIASNVLRSKVAPKVAGGIPVIKTNVLRRGSWRDAE